MGVVLDTLRGDRADFVFLRIGGQVGQPNRGSDGGFVVLGLANILTGAVVLPARYVVQIQIVRCALTARCCFVSYPGCRVNAVVVQVMHMMSARSKPANEQQNYGE